MSVPAVRLNWSDKVGAVVKSLGELPQTECPLKHYFLPGTYVREILMPAGTVVIGKIHKTRHFNIIQKGRVSLFHPDGTRDELVGPHTFVSEPGVQKVLYIHEDTTWTTVHLTEERELAKLEAELIEPSDTYPLIDRTAERQAIALAASERLLA